MNDYLEVLADTLRIATFQARRTEVRPRRDSLVIESSRYDPAATGRRLPRRGR